MPYAAPPTGADVSAYLQGFGFVPSATFVANVLDPAAKQAYADFCRVTGRRMLAPGAPETRTFDLPGRGARFILFEDLCVFTGLTLNSITKVQGTDYRLAAGDGSYDGGYVSGDDPADPSYRPWRSVQLSYPWPVTGLIGQPFWNPVAITGQWGYAPVLPDDAWLAMVQRAAWLGSPALANQLLPVDTAYGGAVPVQSWTGRDGVSETFAGAGLLAMYRATWGGSTQTDEGKSGLGGSFGGVAELYRDVRGGVGAGAGAC